MPELGRHHDGVARVGDDAAWRERREPLLQTALVLHALNGEVARLSQRFGAYELRHPARLGRQLAQRMSLEHALRRIRDVSRQDAARDLSQHPLLAQPAELVLGGEPASEIDEGLVKKWITRLDARVHRYAVSLTDQEVPRQHQLVLDV